MAKNFIIELSVNPNKETEDFVLETMAMAGHKFIIYYISGVNSNHLRSRIVPDEEFKKEYDKTNG